MDGVRRRWGALALAVPGCACMVVCGGAGAQNTLHWKDYTWEIKAGTGLGPGNNRWDAKNVSVDSKGYLHLRIALNGDQWSCAEIDCTTPLGYGTYQFQVEAPLDKFDRNVVLGLFNYGPPTLGPDGTNEIDIEFARWGIADANALNWTVYPGDVKGVKASATAPLTLHNTTSTTNRFVWQRDRVSYQILAGFRNDDNELLQSWSTLSPLRHNLPQSPMPVCINLWLFEGHPPANGQPVEVIIRDFTWHR